MGQSVYYFLSSPYEPIQRLDFTANEELEKVESIGKQPGWFGNPVLFQANSDYCV